MKEGKKRRVELILATLAWLAEQRHLVLYYAARGVQNNEGETTGNHTDLMSFVADGDGVTFLPGKESYLADLLSDLAEVEIEDCEGEQIDGFPEVGDPDDVTVKRLSEGLWMVTRTGVRRRAGRDGEPIELYFADAARRDAFLAGETPAARYEALGRPPLNDLRPRLPAAPAE